jgi:hypothetical protein
MDGIIVEGVRCFHDEQSAPLRPITLLVGENSTGKTTFLALVRIAHDLCQGEPEVDFNLEPFLLGSYDQVASYRGGRGGRVKSFTIGAQVALTARVREQWRGPLRDKITARGTFAPAQGQPRLTHWVLDARPFRVEVRYEGKHNTPRFVVAIPSWKAKTGALGFWTPLPTSQILRHIDRALQVADRPGGSAKRKPEGRTRSRSMATLGNLIRWLFDSLGPRPYGFAPIRTRPQRTYDPIKDTPSPEGSHVPMILAQTFSSDPEGWNKLVRALDAFGQESGLFSDVRVRRMGSKASGPFQINVRISGPHRNLVDVGYGVSQVLPILVDSLTAPERSTFLIQQPEVHLHPKAQAELASFLCVQARHRRHKFVIETHSDSVVDRIRMEVRAKDKLSPEDVALLYFERKDGGVVIDHLRIDNHGNIVNAPPGYRQFFLEEERRLLGS